MRIRFKAKLLLFVLSVVLLPTFGLVIFFISSFNALTSFSLLQNAEGIRQSNREFLTSLASDKARLISLQFKRAVDSVTILGKAAQKLVDSYGELAGLEDIYRARLFRDTLLDYRKALTNSSRDEVNVLIPPSLTSHPRARIYLKVSSFLNLLIGPVFESNENNSFVYFVGDRDDPVTRAYPNINLARVLGNSLDTLFWKGFFPDNVTYWERYYTDTGFRARVTESVGSPVTFDPPYEDAAGQGKIMTLFYPLWNKERNLFAGVAAADVSLAKILENVLAVRVAKTGYGVLINGKGEIIALPDQAEKALKVGVDSIQRNGLKYYYRSLARSEDTGIKAVYGRIMAEDSGYLTQRMDDGRQHVLVFASLDPINDTRYGQDTWKVLINVPERETLDTLFRTNEMITARLTRTTVISLIVVAGSVAVIVLFTFFIADRITRNIGQLSLAAAKISQKNYNIELAIPSRDEIGDLGSAFMQMSREIGNYTEHLEDLVAKRTGELEGAFKEIFHLNEKLKDENLELSRTFIQASLDGFWTNDFSGQILDVNEALCRMLGYSRDELLRMRVQDIEDPDASEKIGSHIQRIVETGGDQFQTHHRRKEGTLIDLEISAQYVAVLGQRFFVFARDITERKRAERDHDRLEAQLRQAQKMESVGRLAGGVAHDFNNMLQVIISYADLALRTTNPADPIRTALSEIMTAGRRSADLTRQLLAFARKQAIAPKVLDLNETTTGMLKMLRRLIGEDIELALVPGRGLWNVKIDPSQVDQILANLAVNARDAISGVGKVIIETGNAEFDERYCQDHAGYLPGQYVMAAVSDDGSGMDEETKAMLFEPFFTTKPQGQGTGLGLATVYGIVTQNGGFISVDSEPGKGTTFRIFFPRHTPETIAVEEARAPVRPSVGTETVLLVDDEEAVLEISATLLKELGYSVLAARTPTAAIRTAEQYTKELHLLMTDVVMPTMSGRDLWHRIRSLRPGIKCLFISGYPADVIANSGVIDEGIQFLSKPFSREALALKLREVLNQS